MSLLPPSPMGAMRTDYLGDLSQAYIAQSTPITFTIREKCLLQAERLRLNDTSRYGFIKNGASCERQARSLSLSPPFSSLSFPLALPPSITIQFFVSQRRANNENRLVSAIFHPVPPRAVVSVHSRSGRADADDRF